MEPSPHVADPDAELAGALRHGSPQAVGRLYDRYGRIAFGLAYRIMNETSAAEDVVQDSFIAAWKNAARFDPELGSVRSWLLTIVRNRAIDRLRSSRRISSQAPLEDIIGGGRAW